MEGYLALILHAHLPYVRHPEHSFFLEEDWLYEAITETYLPLMSIFERLAQDRVSYRLAMTMSPTLLSMLRDPLLQERYSARLDALLELAGKEVDRTNYDPVFGPLARMYQSRFWQCRSLYDRCQRDIVQGFKALQDSGYLEILTCAATHAFLPLHMVTPQTVKAQIQIAVEHYVSILGRNPKGIWLPECGYYPGIDNYLAAFGLRYFILDFHGVMHASPRPKYGVYAPIFCKSGVAAFGRDLESSKQVWSAQEGYPGDCSYREFYRDIGYDLDYDYIRDYIQPNGLRKNTGIKYYRITGKTMDKQPYDEWTAKEKACEHAGNFMFNRERQIEHLAGMLGISPIVVSPYDAELFGHWWFEGPNWLDVLIRRIAFNQQTIRLATPGDYLEMHPRLQVAQPSASSWGYKGYNEVWLEGRNDWIYRHLHKAAERMSELASRFPDASGVLKRALSQAVRELLLGQASDWAFIMKTGTMVPYAVKRTIDHIGRFNQLYEQILSHDGIDEGNLAWLEEVDNIFPNIDYRAFINSDEIAWSTVG